MRVYRVTNSVNGKVYIGKTEFPVSLRWKQHLQNAKAGMPQALYCAIRKYGEGSFIVETISRHQTLEELAIAEIASIYIHKSKNPRYGYNMTDGGEGVSGLKWSAASRKKLSESQIGKIRIFTDSHRLALREAMLRDGRKPSLEMAHSGGLAVREKYHNGFRLSPEVQERIIEARRQAGYTFTDEARSKMRAAKLGKKIGPFSAEHIAAISQSLLGVKRSEGTKKKNRVNAARGRHIRWHVNRSISSPTCELCR